MGKLNKLFKKYNVSNRTKLIEEITNSDYKSSTKVKELRTVKKESQGMKKIQSMVDSPLHSYNKINKTTSNLRKTKKEQYNKKYGCNSIREAIEEKKAEKVLKTYKEIDIPDGFSDVKHEYTVRVEVNQPNNSGRTNYFSIGLSHLDHNKIKASSPRNGLSILEGMLSSMIVSNLEKYKNIDMKNGVKIEKIDGWWGGLYEGIDINSFEDGGNSEGSPYDEIDWGDYL